MTRGSDSKNALRWNLLALGVFLLVSGGLLVGAAIRPASAEEAAQAAPADGDIQVPPPPFSDGIFPCSGCHGEMEVNTERRQLEMMHDDIVLEHGPPSRWCLDCHNPGVRDKLRLASGELIDFSESYLLCGQCHGPKLRDWRAGVHGKRTGEWNGKKQYLLCAHCHDPHSPRFKPIAPEPPPVRPEDLR